MYLTDLSLKNFKCFRDLQLPFAKITLLLGANSSGKSSLISAILGAIQSDQFPLLFSPNGSYVDMGDFRSISFGHRTDHQFEIALRFGSNGKSPVSIRGTFGESNASKLPELVSASYDDGPFKLKIDRKDKYECEWSYASDNDPNFKDIQGEDFQMFLGAMRGLMERKQKKPRKKKPTDSAGTSLESMFDSKNVPSSHKFSFKSPRDFFRASQEDLRYVLVPHVMGVVGTTQGFAERFNYVGAFRHEPLRTYYQVSKSSLRIDRGGGNYVNQIAEWEQRGAPEFRKLKASIRELKLLDEIKTSRLAGGRFEIKVKTGESSVSAGLADVGFGVSQLLPILVADLQLPEKSTLAVSQPEIHLHPSAQADLADYFVERAKKDKKRYIIETHSEYMLNRMRLLIAQGKILASDVSVVYLRSDGPEAASFKINFSKDGRIEGAPKDFFRTYLHDVMDIAITASK
jgi:energy-coupling factor transporter ATP-binding protein EcfA2